MIINAASMSAIYVIGKKLGKVISGDQIAFLYKFGVLVCTIPLVFKDGLKQVVKTKKIKLHIVRAFFSLLATICFYRGLIHIPALDVTAITYMEPIIGLIVGVLYFKESVSNLKTVLVALCMVGVLLIIKPGLNTFNTHYFYLLGALLFWAINNLIIKVLGKTEKTITTLFYVSLFTTIFALPVAMRHSWDGFQIGYMKYVVVMTICHMLHTVSFFRALKIAEMSVVMPFDYSRLFFTGILAYIFLNETPNKISVVGYILIALSGFLMIFYETIKSKKLTKKQIKNFEKKK